MAAFAPENPGNNKDGWRVVDNRINTHKLLHKHYSYGNKERRAQMRLEYIFIGYFHIPIESNLLLQFTDTLRETEPDLQPFEVLFRPSSSFPFQAKT